MIWLTAPLGLVRAKITNDQVQFYNKIDKTYYEGDYAFFSKYLGVEVNYDMLQALILANFMKETNLSKMELSFTNKAYSLKSQNTAFFELIYLLNPSHFKLSQQKILDHFNNRTLSVSYASFQKINSSVIPEKNFHRCKGKYQKDSSQNRSKKCSIRSRIKVSIYRSRRV